MPFRLKIVDWRDPHGVSHPEYRANESLVGHLDRIEWETRAQAEAAAEAAWLDPDCNGIAPVCLVVEC